MLPLRSQRRARSFPSETPTHRRLGQLGEALLVVDLFFCPLALGCARLGAVAVAAAIAGFSLVALALSRHLERRSVGLPLPAFVLAAALFAICLQLCPLPPGLFRLVMPGTDALFASALSPLGLYPAWRPLSLDPPATCRALLTILACLTAFVASAQIASSPRGRARLMGAVGLSALAVALIGFGHELAQARLLLGHVAYDQAAPPFLSTFGNPNHLAAFLTAGALALSVRALDTMDRRKRFAWWLAYLAVASALFLSLSRGGIIAFLIGQALVVWNSRALNAGESVGVGSQRRLLALLSLGASLAIALYLAAQNLIGEWSSLTSIEGLKTSKLSLFKVASPLLREHWLFGVGKGAFEPAFTRFLASPDGGARTFTHPENLPLQWIVDMGVVPGSLLLAGLAYCLFKGCREARRDVLRWGALIAVFTLGLHDLADFSLEFLGVALPASALLAIGVTHRRGAPRLPARAILGGAAIAAALGSASFLGARADLRRDGQALLEAENLDRRALLDVLRRHPADYFPRLVAATKSLEAGHPGEALAWAGQAMRLYPALAAPHAVAARALERMGAFAQAGTEWKLALERGQDNAGDRLSALFRLGLLPAEDLPRFAPSDPARALRLARRLFNLQQTGLALALLDHLDEISQARSLDRLILRARIAERRRDPQALLALGIEIEAIEGSAGHQGLLFQVSALVQAGDEPAARDRLAAGLRRAPSAPLSLRLAELELRRGDTEAARQALRRLPAALDLSQRVRALTLEAAAARRDGAHAKALSPLRTAVNLSPGDVNLRLNLVEALERAGHLDEALREIRLCRGKSTRAEAIEARIADRKARLEDAARRRALGLAADAPAAAPR